jgi:ferredoxin
MTINVNQEACIGCGACEAICPDTFKMNDEGKSEAISQENSECAAKAAESCPVQAITIS